MSTVPQWEFIFSAPSQSVGLADDAKTVIDCFHRDLISFLSIARFYNVDLLPMAWDQHRNALGRGASGEVMQLAVNVQTSYAFKRFKKPDKNIMFRELISEVMLLEQRLIKTHPNIIDLQGITLEFDHDTQEVSPVLVFERAQFGSLRMFMDSDGNGIPFAKKLKLCSEIGSAIKTMHDMDVIHGDIKPDNVLVFGNSIDEAKAKVIDFGYSCMGAKDKDLVYLPMSRGWCAPEYHDRGIELHRAKKMDIYSFGMVCLWMLFGEDFPELESDLARTGDHGHLQQSAMDHALRVESLGPELREFFRLALCEDWQERGEDLGSLISLLGHDTWEPRTDRPFTLADFGTNREDINDPQKLRALTERIFRSMRGTGTERRDLQVALGALDFSCEDTKKIILELLEIIHKNPPNSFEQDVDGRYTLIHNCFNLADDMYQLIYLDHRTKHHIVKCLEIKAADKACEECSAQAAFQVAFCYRIGFGVPSDHKEAQHWLGLSSEDDAALEDYIDRLRRTVVLDSVSGTLTEFISRGYIKMGFTDRDPNDEELAVAEKNLERELRDFEACIGGGHYLVLTMKHILQCIKESLGKSVEADQIAWELKDSTEKILGPDSPLALSTKVYLAERCRIQHRWKEAEELALEVEQRGGKYLGLSHPLMSSAVEVLTRIRIDTRENEEGEAALSALLQTMAEVYGPNDIQELTIISNSGWRKMLEGELGMAEDLLLHAKKGFEAILGPDSDQAIMTTRNLALTYRNQGRIQKAEETQVALKNRAERVLGPERRETFEIIYDLGRTYQMQERWAEAAEMQVKVRVGRGRIYGADDEKTLDATHRLEEICMRLVGLKAEGTLMELKDTLENTLGCSSLETLGALKALSLVYLAQGRFKRAEESMIELKKLYSYTLGPEHKETLGTMSNLGQVYFYQQRYQEGEETLMEALSIMERVLGPEDGFTKITAQALIRIRTHQGEFGDTIQNLRGQTPPATSMNFEFLTQIEVPSPIQDDEEERLLNEAIAMSLGQLDSDIPEPDEDEMIRQAIELSLQHDDSDTTPVTKAQNLTHGCVVL